MRNKLYRCSWPNGDVSLVWAPTKDEAIWCLDEEDAATREMLDEVTEVGALHFVPVQEDYGAEWGFERISERWLDTRGPLSLDSAEERLKIKQAVLAAAEERRQQEREASRDAAETDVPADRS